MSRAEDQCPECGEQRIDGKCWRCKDEPTWPDIAKELWEALDGICDEQEDNKYSILGGEACKVRDKYRERFSK
jgi:hypothetical protein